MESNRLASVSPIIFSASAQLLKDCLDFYLGLPLPEPLLAPVACDLSQRKCYGMVSSPNWVVVPLAEFSTLGATFCSSYHVNNSLYASPAMDTRASQLQHY